MECGFKKIVNYDKCYEYNDKQNVKHVTPSTNYYACVNGKNICIKPVFDTDKEILDFLSVLIVVGDKNNKKVVEKPKKTN